MDRSQTIYSVLKHKRLKSLITIGLILCSLTIAQVYKYRSDVHNLKESFIHDKQNETDKVSQVFLDKLNYIYQSLRTMSLLPGVRTIDRHASNWDENSKTTFQQIYNNAFTNIQLSEVYILPKTLDPDIIDPTTNKPEEPILTYDEFIVGSEEKKKEEEQTNKLEEVEIEEYHLMKKQLQFLGSSYANNKNIKGLEIPVVSGEEVITCDNSEFTKQDFESHNDFPRKGLVFTVPTFDRAGNFSGGVSAVIRSKVLMSYLPKGRFVIVNRKNNIYLIDSPIKEWGENKKYFEDEKLQNTTTIFSSLTKLNFPDQSPWEIWSISSNDDLFASQEYKSAFNMFWGGLLAIFAFGVLLIWQNFKDYKLFKHIAEVIISLTEETKQLNSFSSEISEASRNLKDSSMSQTSAAEETAASTNEISAMTKKTEDNSQSVILAITESCTTASEGQQAVKEMLDSIKEIGSSSAEMMNEIRTNNEKLSKIVKTIEEIGLKTKIINDIVFQTKLLSFNASVEAARAGENGKGFAVVAEEVGNLAQMSGNASREISKMLDSGIQEVNHLVQEIQDKVSSLSQNVEGKIKKGFELGNICNVKLDKIVSTINKANASSSEINDAIKEQAIGTEQISKSISLVSENSHKNLENANRIEGVSSELTNESKKLTTLVQDLEQIISNKVPEKIKSPDNLKSELNNADAMKKSA